MEHQGDQLSDYFSQIESSPWRAKKAETAYLRAQLQIAEDELYKLDTDLAILLANRSRVIRRIQRCRTSLAPYSKLPIELIREVILLCIPDVCKLPLMLGKNDPRLQMTQICSSWRKVAFGIPELWNVHLEKLPGESIVKLLAAWFRQSSSTQIVLTMLKRNADFSVLLLEKVIIPYARRFKTLDCSIMVVPGQWNSLTFDVLSNFSLRFFSFTPEKGDRLNAPFLRNLEVTNFNRPPHADGTLLQFFPAISWDRLTSISVSGWIELGDIYDVLSLCKSLEHCKLDDVHGDSRSSNGNIPTVSTCDLLSLKHLWIRFSSPQSFNSLFLFNVPNLTSLAVTLPLNELEVLECFAKFVGAKEKTLRSFESIRDYRNLAFPIHKIMLSLRFITHFVVNEHIALTTLAQVGIGELLPNVEVLEFAPKFDHTVDEILDVLVPQQSNRTSSLANINIRNPMLYCLPQRIEKLRSWGINVRQFTRVEY